MKRRVPYSIEVRISDDKGRRIYHWRDGANNLALGMKRTTEFISEKLNVNLKEIEETVKNNKETKIKQLNNDINNIKENTKQKVIGIETK